MSMMLRRRMMLKMIGGGPVVPVYSTATGNPAMFSTIRSAPLQSLVTDINLLQTGSGNPSPSNVRPITGWTGVNISHSGANTANPTVIPVTWQVDAGTVYQGTIDVISGVLTATWVSVEYDGSSDENWKCSSNVRYYIGPPVAPHYVRTSSAYIKGNIAKSVAASALGSTSEDVCFVYGTGSIGIAKASIYNNLASFRTFLSNNPAQLVYQVETPIVYQLTPQQINALLGVNNIWANTGDVSVTYQSN